MSVWPAISTASFTACQPAAVPLRLAVVVPCYRVRRHVAQVLRAIGPEVWRIYCIDDACPERSGDAAESVRDSRIQVLRHERNQGVGGAMVTGYRQAVADGAEVVVKIDGDGQMDPGNIQPLVGPILRGEADYVKGNRFFYVEGIRVMPRSRLIGNIGLSFMSKLSTGYWNLFDPNNGYTAIHAAMLRALPLDKLSRRYFFESDMLFRLGTLRAVVSDVPMHARYGDEQSNMNVFRVLGAFPFYHARNFFKRLFYNYFLRNFSVASLDLVFGTLLLAFGAVFGGWHWIRGTRMNMIASPGTVMVATLPVLLGFQMLLSFITIDMGSVPREPIHPKLQRTFQCGGLTQPAAAAEERP